MEYLPLECDVMFRAELQKILRQVEGTINIHDLAEIMKMQVDPLLERIIVITTDFKTEYKNNVSNMMKGTKEFNDVFFKKQIIDLGFLCQHKIKEIRDNMKEKHNTFGHQMFYDAWLLYRGY